MFNSFSTITNELLQALNALFLRLFLALSLCLFLSTTSISQLSEDYVPLLLDGIIEQDFLKRAKGNFKFKLKNTQKLTKIQKEQFLKATQHTVKNIFQNGNVYFNDPLTRYIRVIGNKLLTGTAYKHKIKIFISRYPSVNATSWQDGTILVNIGLLSRIENEDQLAFVIAHEISHFIKQHGYEQYAQFLKNKAAYSDFVTTLKYGLKYEFEADEMALSLVKKAGYDISESLAILEIVQGKRERSIIDFYDYFASTRFKIERNHRCDALGKQLDIVDEREQVIRDINKRHVNQRYKRLEDLISVQQIFTTKSYVPTSRLFDKIKNIAQFELVEQSFKESNFLKSIHESLILLKKFPENRYLHIKIAECLYAIHSYNNLARGYFEETTLKEAHQTELICFFDNLSERDLNDLVYGFIQTKYENFSYDQYMLIIMAKTVENYFKMEYAKPYYEQYIKRFPDGDHIILAKRKLQ